MAKKKSTATTTEVVNDTPAVNESSENISTFAATAPIASAPVAAAVPMSAGIVVDDDVDFDFDADEPKVTLTPNKVTLTHDSGGMKEAKITATLTPATPDKEIVWTLHEENKVVDFTKSEDGKSVTAKVKENGPDGRVTIYASVKNSLDSASCQIDVSSHAELVVLDWLNLDKNKLEFTLGENKTETLTAIPDPEDATGVEKTAWKVDNPDIVSLDTTTGLTVKVTPLKAGTAKITASCSGESDTCTVTVNEPKNDDKEDNNMGTETTTGTVASVMSTIVTAPLHDTSGKLDDSALMALFDTYAVAEDNSAPIGATGVTFSAKLANKDSDLTHTGDGVTGAWVGLSIIPNENDKYACADYNITYSCDRNKPAYTIMKSLEALDENVDGAGKKGLAFYFDLNTLVKRAASGEYIWLTIDWKYIAEDESVVVTTERIRVALDVAIDKLAAELASTEGRRAEYTVSEEITETVNGKKIPDWTKGKKAKIKKILKDRVLVRIGRVFTMALPHDSITKVEETEEPAEEQKPAEETVPDTSKQEPKPDAEI